MKFYRSISIVILLQYLLTASFLYADKIENTRIKMLNGEYAKLLDFNTDGPLIVNFWTTWWPFCERQLAYLDQLNENFRNTGLQVLTVNTNKPNILNQVRPYINKRKYKFPVSVDPRSKLAKQFGVLGFPTLFLIDKNGNIIHKSSGYEDGQEEVYLEKLVEYLESENIEYDDFKYVKQTAGKKDSNINIDFWSILQKVQYW